MVTLSIIIIDTLIKLTAISATRVFLTAAWLKLPEASKWKQGFIETMLQLNMLHLGDLDAQIAHSIRTLGCRGPSQVPPEHLVVLEGLLRKLLIDTDAFFIQDFQVLPAAALSTAPPCPQRRPVYGAALSTAPPCLRRCPVHSAALLSTVPPCLQRRPVHSAALSTAPLWLWCCLRLVAEAH